MNDEIFERYKEARQDSGSYPERRRPENPGGCVYLEVVESVEARVTAEGLHLLFPSTCR